MDGVQNLDSSIACLVMLARFHGLAAQSEQIRHQFSDTGSLDSNSILRAAKSLKLKARKINVDLGKLQDLPLPAMAQHQDGHYFIIARLHEGKALIQNPLKQQPETVSIDVLETLLTGCVAFNCCLNFCTRKIELI